MKKKKLTICCPVYNTEKYVGAMIESVLGQTYGDFDFLLYDDGSTDGSLDVIQSYKDDRVHVIKGGENKGGIWGRTQIINQIDTKYNMWIDSDDVFNGSDAVERAMKKAVKGDYDIVNFVRVVNMKSDGTSEVDGSYAYGDFTYSGEKLLEKFYPMDNHMNFTSKVFKTDLIKKSVPEDDILGRRFIMDDLFFAPLWFFHCRNYCHDTTSEPIYLYHSDIGIAGSRQGDVSPERIGAWCIMLWHLLVSVYNRMSACRPIRNEEIGGVVEGALFSNMARIIGKAREKFGDSYGDNLMTIWHSAFGADGVHLLNGIDMFECKEYIRVLNEIMKGERHA